jgi:glyceraldehyde-3-phosphate dehydrogenase (NAD(P))
MVKIRVGVNGFGTIGKRCAFAVSRQKDMQLVGVANRSVNINVRGMIGEHGQLYKTPLYCSDPKNEKTMESTGFKVSGSLEDLLDKVDIIIDGTPAGIESQNKPLYEKHGIKQIYHGGAAADVAQVSFSSIANYEKAFGKKSVRVVSCNTTSLVRTIYATKQAMDIKDIMAVLVRRATDPHEDDGEGPIISVIPTTKTPSHHGPDVKTVMPDINIMTMSCKVPTTLNHTHFVAVTLDGKYTRDYAVEAFRKASRVMLFREADGYKSSSQIFENFRDMDRERASDMYEVGMWEESINVDGNKLYWCNMVHSEAIPIPETVDAIRALSGFKEKQKSIDLTNKSLGIEK